MREFFGEAQHEFKLALARNTLLPAVLPVGNGRHADAEKCGYLGRPAELLDDDFGLEHVRDYSMLEADSSSILRRPYGTIRGMTSIGERITARLDELKPAGKDVAGLAGYCGVTPSAVYQWKNDETELIATNLVRAAEYLETHCQWLVLEKGPKDRRIKASDLEPDEEALIINYRRLSPEDQHAMSITVHALVQKGDSQRGRKP